MAKFPAKYKSLYQREFNPIKIALLFTGVLALFLLIAYFLNELKIIDTSSSFGFLCSSIVILLYALFCSVLVVSTHSANVFWQKSLLGYLILLLLGVIISYMYSNFNQEDLKAFLSIFIVISMGFLVFMSIMMSVRWIMDKSGMDS